jgi:phenylacetate-CoA ligase
MLAYTQGAAALARHVNRTNARTWDDLPVICGAERLWPSDRDQMVKAFGPGIFESYGCREVMLIGHECDRHDGLHLSMETMIVEVLVREAGGMRAARPGEIGEVAVTDLHNLSHPLIRYIGGDRAVMRAPEPCACGRTLPRIGPIDGRVTDTLRDGAGQPVNGLLFSILFVSLEDEAREFQIVQRASGDLVVRVVMTTPGARSRRTSIASPASSSASTCLASAGAGTTSTRSPRAPVASVTSSWSSRARLADGTPVATPPPLGGPRPGGRRSR